DAAPPATIAAVPFIPFETSPPIKVFWHGPPPLAAVATATPGTALHATFVAAPFTAPCTFSFPATCFALFSIPPNLLFLGLREWALAESTAVGAGAWPDAGVTNAMKTSDASATTRAFDI